jgi:hypothetical protein
MSDHTEAARYMRESAKELRRIASLQCFLEPKLLRIARELEERPGQLDNVLEPQAAE